MKIIMIIFIMSCIKNNFIYDNMYKNDINYYFNNLDKLNENTIPYVIDKAEEGDNKALFLYIYLSNIYSKNQQLKSKRSLLRNTNNLIEYLYNNNEFRTLGYLYHYGVPGQLKVNADEAIGYYTKAINIGNSYSAFNLGLLYYYGIRGQLKPNICKAIKYYIEASNTGDPNALFTLGDLYQYGIKGHLEPSANKAIEYYTKAIDIGNFNAALNLGYLYHYGVKGQLEPNIYKAIEYYTKAMDMGESEGALNLGYLYRYGKEGELEPNIKKTIEYYDKAIEMGDYIAAYNLGDLYQYGIEGELEPNVDKTIEYYNKAINIGNPYVKYLLGVFYNSLIKKKLNIGIDEAIKYAFDLYNRYNYMHYIVLKTFNTYNYRIENYNESEFNSIIDIYTNNIRGCYGIVLEQKIVHDSNSTVSSFIHSPINNDLYPSYDYICNYLESLLHILPYFSNHTFMIDCIKLKDISNFNNNEDDYVNIINIKDNEYLCLGLYKVYKNLVEVINGKEQLLNHISKAISNVDNNNNLNNALNEIINIESQLYNILIYTTSLRNINFINKYKCLFNN